ncbi:MAG: hypothetical protein DRP85_04350 [Candidatus Makaraimicrobium thalassicum]|nr:MAG: hypothetical protein DRP85_04350 [Candidatus Omnitrophota bacterium]
MPRAPRIHIEEGLYLITTRGDHGGKLFKDDADRYQYLDLLAKYREQYRFKAFSYVLMPAFVHLLIELAGHTTISEIMHVIDSTYTKYFNGRYERHGHLFQERFRAVVVEKEPHLAELTRYIHLVPVKAGPVDRPEDYEWTSCRYYLEKAGKDPLEVSDAAKEVLKRFSSDPDEQVKLYREFLGSLGDDKFKLLGRKLQRTSVFGSKAFVEEVKKEAAEEALKEKEEEDKAWVASRAHKVFILAGGLAVIILSIAAIYAYRKNLGLENLLQKKEAEFGEKLSVEQTKLRRDLEEKYKADMVSYKAAVKRLEIEKKRAENR